MSQTVQELEEAFLTGISEAEIPVGRMLDILRDVAAAGKAEQADNWADLLQEALIGKGARKDAVRLLEMRASWHADEPAFSDACLRTAAQILGKGKVGERLVESIGLSGSLPLAECLSRLQMLVHMEPGVLCYDKTWGFGVIRRVDSFYQEVEIDFDKKASHRMLFGYAVQALQLLDNDHILARKHRDPEELESLVRTNPAEVVKLALRSYGPMNAARLQEMLVGSVVEDANWRVFWDAARQALKADPLVEVPAARKDPIRLLEKERSYGPEWFALLSRERDLDKLLSMIEEAETNAPDMVKDDVFRKTAADRLGYVIRGASEKQPGILVTALMVARRLALDLEGLDVRSLTEQFTDPARFFSAAKDLSVRDLEELLAHLAAHDRDRAIQLLFGGLADMTLGLLNEAMDFLFKQGQEQKCVDFLRGLIGARRETIEILYWLARRLDFMEAQKIAGVADIPFFILDGLRSDYSGERLKAANQLRALFHQHAWFDRVVEAMTPALRRELMLRLNDPVVIASMDGRALMARLIKTHPELNEVLGPSAHEAEQGHVLGGFTSWRSYKARQQQFERLVTEEIPRNSRDIGTAISYGDLSENYEYKAAKEHQQILIRRKRELEQDLHDVKGTDFAEFPKAAAGMGTAVTLRHADGRVESLFILGEWDQDPGLSIIGCKSRLAQILAGHRKGDEVMVPSEQAETPATIIEVGDLSDEIKNWLRGG